MKSNCEELHRWANKLTIFNFSFDPRKIPLNGIYLLFEKNEKGHGTRRIVRVGTHTGANQLRSRLSQHFLTENKDRSIFRKNIGRAILNKSEDPFLDKWEVDLTEKEARNKYLKSIDMEKQTSVEKSISKYMKENFYFVALGVDNKGNRLSLESKIISTVSLCNQCGPSKKWLGLYSPKEKIRKSGLWQVNELYKKPLTNKDLAKLKKSDKVPKRGKNRLDK